MLLDLEPLDVNDLVVGQGGLEVAQFVGELTFGVLTTEHVNSVQNCVTHPCQLIWISGFFLECDSASLRLSQRLKNLLVLNSRPLVVVQIERKHFSSDGIIL